MKKMVFSLCLFFFHAGVLLAQKGDLIVKSGDNGLYLEHKVAAKETFYSVGRLYNLHPKSIAAFNKLDMNKGLNIDQKIRIPLLDTNFTQHSNTGTPVYYKVEEKEGLLTVSKKNRNVSLANLRSWNNLTGDMLKKDQKLIIGFLQTKEMKQVTVSNTLPATQDPPVVKKEEKTEATVPPVTPAEEMSKKEEKKIAEEEEKAEKKEEKSAAPPVVKETRKPVAEGQGYFKKDFEQQVKVSPVMKEETVTAGIFKTTSGWEDAKYYLLIDKVQPGTIVKVVNPANNKSIFAKVLGEMAGIRQNEGYNIRISNAGAAALDITEQDKFIVKVNY
ncbi:MAG: LysM peptidoglycan-binding domain-containing protein [Chitinophagaceae bacterium]